MGLLWRSVMGCVMGCVVFWVAVSARGLARSQPANPVAGLWLDRLTPPNLADRAEFGEHLVLFEDGRFYDPFDPSQCQPAQTLVADYAGTWTRTEEGFQLDIVLERVLTDVTCLCAEDEDGVSTCEVSFSAEVVRRAEGKAGSAGKVVIGREVGFSDGDQRYPTPGEGDDVRYPTAEILGHPYYLHPLKPASPAAYMTLPGRALHPEVLEFFGCKAAADGKVSC